jgi:hypothetical protein
MFSLSRSIEIVLFLTDLDFSIMLLIINILNYRGKVLLSSAQCFCLHSTKERTAPQLYVVRLLRGTCLVASLPHVWCLPIRLAFIWCFFNICVLHIKVIEFCLILILKLNKFPFLFVSVEHRKFGEVNFKIGSSPACLRNYNLSRPIDRHFKTGFGSIRTKGPLKILVIKYSETSSSILNEFSVHLLLLFCGRLNTFYNHETVDLDYVNANLVKKANIKREIFTVNMHKVEHKDEHETQVIKAIKTVKAECTVNVTIIFRSCKYMNGLKV